MDEAAFNVALEYILTQTQREQGVGEKLKKLLLATSIEDLPAEAADYEEAKTVQVLLLQLKSVGITNAKFDITLMRGFDYYTDIVFEIFDTNPKNNRAMMGGGRYDGLVAQFGVEPLPTVGFAFGDAPFLNFLEVNDLLPELSTELELYVMLLGDVTMLEASSPIAELREMGVNVFVDFTGRKLDKQFKTALKKQAPFALFIGSDELESSQYTLKNLETQKKRNTPCNA